MPDGPLTWVTKKLAWLAAISWLIVLIADVKAGHSYVDFFENIETANQMESLGAVVVPTFYTASFIVFGFLGLLTRPWKAHPSSFAQFIIYPLIASSLLIKASDYAHNGFRHEIPYFLNQQYGTPSTETYFAKDKEIVGGRGGTCNRINLQGDSSVKPMFVCVSKSDFERATPGVEVRVDVIKSKYGVRIK